jgi:hypothetical protein
VIYARLVTLGVITKCMAYCELCEMDREFCEHGLGERRRAATVAADELLILIPRTAWRTSRGARIRGDDPDYSRWAWLDVPRAWERLGKRRAAARHRWRALRPDRQVQMPGLRKPWSLVTARGHVPAGGV